MAKVTINISQGIIEAEGSEEFVSAQIQKFQSTMLPTVQEIAGRLAQTKKELQLGDADPQIIIESDGQKIEQELSLRDIAVKMLPKGEPEWVLIYGYFVIKSEKQSFTKDDVIQQYQNSGRKNHSRMSNLQKSIKAATKNDWISILGEEDYILKPNGYDEVKKILARNEGGTTTMKKTENKYTKKASTTKKSAEAYHIVNSLDLHPPGQPSLIDFYKQKSPNNDGTAMESTLIFTHNLQKTAGIKGIAPAHIYTCFKEVGIKIPVALKQNLIDTANRKGWVNVTDIENITVSTRGENYIEHNLPKVSA